MEKKMKAKVVLAIIRNKRIIKEFEDWLNDTQAMQELREMDSKSVVGIMREVWEELKSTN